MRGTASGRYGNRAHRVRVVHARSEYTTIRADRSS